MVEKGSLREFLCVCRFGFYEPYWLVDIGESG